MPCERGRVTLIVIRCTASLLARLRIDTPVDVGTSSGALGDWYATVLQVRRA